MKKYAVIGLSMILFGCTTAITPNVEQISNKTQSSSNYSSQNSSSIQSQFSLSANAPLLNQRFALWIATWRKILPAFQLAALSEAQSSSLHVISDNPITADRKATAQKMHYGSISPDGTRRLTWSYDGCLPEDQPCLGDSNLLVLDDYKTNNSQVLESSDTQAWDDGTWLSNDEFVVVRHIDSVCEDGNAGCISPYLQVYDLKEKTIQNFFGGWVDLALYQKRDFANLKYLRARMRQK